MSLGLCVGACDCMTVDVVDSCMHLKWSTYLWFFQVAGLVLTEGYASGLQDAGLLALFCGVYGVGDWGPVEKEGSGL